MPTLLLGLLVPLLPLVDGPDPTPADNDVTAGWTALLVFAGLIVAVVFLARSLVKQLRRAQAARDAGVYGDPPAGSESPESTDESHEHPAQS